MRQFIHEDDIVGRAMLGALCRAVQRGVDVRVVVDAIGSLGTPRESLAALEICEENAGWIRNAQGQTTNRRARAQVVLFNAPTRFAGSPNRRSHDKLLVIDGAFVDKGMAGWGEVLSADDAEAIRAFIDEGVPLFGICLGHQLLGLAAGAKGLFGSLHVSVAP